MGVQPSSIVICCSLQVELRNSPSLKPHRDRTWRPSITYAKTWITWIWLWLGLMETNGRWILRNPWGYIPSLLVCLSVLISASQPSGHHGSFLRRLFLIAATAFGPFVDAYYFEKSMASRPEQRNTKASLFNLHDNLHVSLYATTVMISSHWLRKSWTMQCNKAMTWYCNLRSSSRQDRSFSQDGLSITQASITARISHTPG